MALTFTFSFGWSPKPRTHRLIVLSTGLALLALCITLSINSLYELKIGKRVAGEVIGYQHSARIGQFSNEQGQLIEFEIPLQGDLFKPGNSVKVIYFENSSRTPKVDHFLSFWLFPIFTAIFAFMFLITALILWLKEVKTNNLNQKKGG
ncbi:MAG: hypothetical protein HRU38_04905 [Saccharospirillaceae bacterium]|nr:DUF3592 domain-containing protein [Pseudomonadales bacterium]NRB77996.1 hypothetical protein [Saccharospirillaceae bacterium]